MKSIQSDKSAIYENQYIINIIKKLFDIEVDKIDHIGGNYLLKCGTNAENARQLADTLEKHKIAENIEVGVFRNHYFLKFALQAFSSFKEKLISVVDDASKVGDIDNELLETHQVFKEDQKVIDAIKNLFSIKVDKIDHIGGNYLLKCGINAENARQLADILEKYKIVEHIEVDVFRNHYFLKFAPQEFLSFKEKLTSLADQFPKVGDIDTQLTEIQQAVYGNHNNDVLSNITFTQDDVYINPRVYKSKESRALKPQVQEIGREIMEFVGVTPSSHGFPNKDVSTLQMVYEGKETISLNNGGYVNDIYTKEHIEKSLKSVKIFYDQSVSGKDNIIESLNIRNELGEKEITPELTHIAGHRIITGKCHIFNNNKFEKIDKFIEVTVIDTSAPNLASPFNYDKYFVNGELNVPVYKDEMLSRVKLLIKAAQSSDCESVVIPAIGSGAFARGHEEEVTTVIAECFKEVLDGMQDGKTLTSIVFSVLENNYDCYQKVFASYNGNINVMVTNAEMTNVAIKLKKQGIDVGYVIAGHPTRKVGNGWEIDENGCGAQAQEETCTKHFVDLIAAFDVLWNSDNIIENITPIDLGSDELLLTGELSEF